MVSCVATQLTDEDDRFEASLGVLKALADVTRWRIVWALRSREKPVSELAAIAGAQVAATSQHLARLREAGLIASRRDGTRIFYRLASPQVVALAEQVMLTTTAVTGAPPSSGAMPGAATADAVVPGAVPGVATARPRLAPG